MDSGNKRKPDNQGMVDTSNKRVKTEDFSDPLNTDLDQLLGQGSGGNDLDFGNLPDDLLDTIDDTVATPDLGKSISRSITPQVATPSDDLKRQMSGNKINNYSNQLMLPKGNATDYNDQSHQYNQANQQQNQQQQLLHSNDPSKLNDALAAAGVDIQHEEELLMQQRNRITNIAAAPSTHITQRNPFNNFLHPYHVSASMLKSARENGVVQNFLQDAEVLELMSTSCEKWISDIVTKTLLMARHRQRSTPIGKSKSTNGKSDLYQELRNLAKKHREMEEKRVDKRIILGLEKGDENGKDDKLGGSEETLHRAANATAAMMTMNPGRKKYSWMTSSGNNGNGGAAVEKETTTKRSHLLTLRGENGIRLNNTRITQAITMKDLLSAIEDERMGVLNAIIKGYSKLRD